MEVQNNAAIPAPEWLETPKASFRLGVSISGTEGRMISHESAKPDRFPPEHDLARTYRVEHRLDCGCVSHLATVHHVFPHHDTLLPYVSHLRLLNTGEPLAGELVLVDVVTGNVHARRNLRSLPRGPRHHAG